MIILQSFLLKGDAIMNERRIDASNLTKVEETLFITLYARALDSVSKNSILDDKTAQDIVSQINYNFKDLKVTKEKYNTAIRTKELDMRIERFIANHKNAIVLGISRDSLASHDKFIDKLNLPFILLSDVEETVCNIYQVIKEKNMYGKKSFGIERSTFIIDEEGNLLKIFRKVEECDCEY